MIHINYNNVFHALTQLHLDVGPSTGALPENVGRLQGKTYSFLQSPALSMFSPGLPVLLTGVLQNIMSFAQFVTPQMTSLFS
jgi:hypothetical protein